jgi:hypothetical protein
MGPAAPGSCRPEASVIGLLVRQTVGSSRLPVRIQARAVAAGTVTVTGLRPMPVDIAVRSVCSLG